MPEKSPVQLAERRARRSWQIQAGRHRRAGRHREAFLVRNEQVFLRAVATLDGRFAVEAVQPEHVVLRDPGTKVQANPLMAESKPATITLNQKRNENDLSLFCCCGHGLAPGARRFAQRAPRLAPQDEVQAVAEYRKAYAEKPQRHQFKSRLKQAELKAADFYYQRARIAEQGNLDSAVVQFQQGLIAMPDHSKLLQAMNETLARKKPTCSTRKAKACVRPARPTTRCANSCGRARFRRAQGGQRCVHGVAQGSSGQGGRGHGADFARTGDVNFRQSDLKQAFEFLAKSFGINVIFDEAVKSVPVTLFAKDVTFEQGLNLLLTTTKTFSKRIGPNSVLIAPDSEEKRGQYEDHMVRTYQLNSAKAKDTADHLKSLLAIKKITINEQLNFLVIMTRRNCAWPTGSSTMPTASRPR